MCVDCRARRWAEWLGWRATRGGCLQGLFSAVFRRRLPPTENPKRRVTTRVRTARCDCPRLRRCPGGKRLWVGTSCPPYERIESSSCLYTGAHESTAQYHLTLTLPAVAKLVECCTTEGAPSCLLVQLERQDLCALSSRTRTRQEDQLVFESL